jgi:hypothetical protein
MKNNCIEFKVKQNESAHYNVQNHNFQDNVKYSIDIFETIKPANFICAFYSFTKIPKKYFGNADTEPKRYIDKREPARWKVIQKVMIDNNIKEVIVRLCPLDNKVNLKTSYISKTNPISPKASSNTTIQNISIDKQIDEKFEKLDWNKLKNKQTPKLLIIGCSDSKTQGGVNQNEINYFNSPEYANLLNDRNANKIRYNRLLLTDPNYFIIKNNGTNIKRGNIPVTNTYFSNCINGNLFKTALDRYAGGDFYKPAHILLYRQKNVSANLHILIISGLYGVIEFNDTILDYHLEIDKLKYWKNRTSINDTINKYIVENKIDNNSVFYSLSDKYLEVLKPVSNLWTNLWVKNGRSGSGKTSASFILRFLNQL